MKVILLLMLFLGGCAAGRGPAGEVVVGFDVAKLPETGSEVIGAAVNALLPGWGPIAGSAAVALGGLLLGVKKHGDAKAAKAAHEAENKGYAEGQVDMGNRQLPPKV